MSVTKILSEKLVDDHRIAVSSLVAAANGTVALMDNIQAGVSIACGVMSLIIGFFTIRYYIIKTKNLNK